MTSTKTSSFKKKSDRIRLNRYVPTRTAKRFHASDQFVKCIIGCVGAGKTTICLQEQITRSLEQPPDLNGVRSTRHGIIRNTFPELESTVLNSLKDWLPEKLPDGTPFLKVRFSSPMKAKCRFPLADGTLVDMEFILLALNTAEDVAKLRSLELTTCLLSEAGELDEAVYDMACTRVGRFPKKDPESGTPGPAYHGVLIESNPPTRAHWIYRLGVVEKPKNWLFLMQPPAMFPVEEREVEGGIEVTKTRYVLNEGQRKPIPPAENLDFLPENYYPNLVQGKSHDWIKVYVCGQFGHVMSGRPVYPEWNPTVHVSLDALHPSPGLPVIVGLDYGLDHSAILGQMSPNGRLVILDELTTRNCGSRRFIKEHLEPLLASSRFAGCSFIFVGDPAGNSPSQSDERSCVDVFLEEGFRVHPAPTNAFIARRDAVAQFLTTMVEGGPGILLDPGCAVLSEGFSGGYHYRKMKTGDGDRYSDEPEKNRYSHPHDALQYLCLHARKGRGVEVEDPFTGRIRYSASSGALPSSGSGPAQRRRVVKSSWNWT